MAIRRLFMFVECSWNKFLGRFIKFYPVVSELYNEAKFALFWGYFSLDNLSLFFRGLNCPVVFRFLNWMLLLSWKGKTNPFPSLTLGSSFFNRLFFVKTKCFMTKEKVVSFNNKKLVIFLSWSNERHVSVLEVSLD